MNRKIRKTAITVDKNRKPETKFEKTRKLRKTPKPKHPKPTIDFRKTENPNAPTNPQSRESLNNVFDWIGTSSIVASNYHLLEDNSGRHN